MFSWLAVAAVLSSYALQRLPYWSPTAFCVRVEEHPHTHTSMQAADYTMHDRAGTLCASCWRMYGELLVKCCRRMQLC